MLSQGVVAVMDWCVGGGLGHCLLEVFLLLVLPVRRYAAGFRWKFWSVVLICVGQWPGFVR